MTTARLSAMALLGLTISVATGCASRGQAYDKSADGSRQIAAAAVTAQAEHKRVLVILGANWCPWSRRLHGLIVGDSAVRAAVGEGYVPVFLDVDGSHNRDVDLDFGEPTQNGIPAVAILDSHGHLLKTEDPAAWETRRGYDSRKVISFLTSQRSGP